MHPMHDAGFACADPEEDLAAAPAAHFSLVHRCFSFRTQQHSRESRQQSCSHPRIELQDSGPGQLLTTQALSKEHFHVPKR